MTKKTSSPIIIKSFGNLTTTNTYSSWVSLNGYSTNSIQESLFVLSNTGNSVIAIGTPGITSVGPNENFVFTNIATTQAQANQFIIYNNGAAITKSINFLYDFGFPVNFGPSNSISFEIKIATPPNVPLAAPSFQYSLESSIDFINWTYLSDSNLTTKYNANVGKVVLSFSGTSLVPNTRFCRIRLYKNSNVTFDPSQNYNYSNFAATYSSTVNVSTNGQFILGLTNVSAYNSSLSSLMNLPTYLRIQNSSNTSTVCSVALDFTKYQASVNGPTYLKLITDQGERILKVFETEINFSNTYILNLNISRTSVQNGYNLVPTVSLISNSKTLYTSKINDFILEPQNSDTFDFGFYPFASLVGLGYFNSQLLFSQSGSNVSYLNSSQTNLTLFSNRDPEFSPNFGKNLIYQNTFDTVSTSFPQVGNYFSLNPAGTTIFDYNNIDSRPVRAVATQSIVLYGLQSVDGIYVNDSDYVLVTAQGDTTQNGLYEVTSNTWNQVYLPSPSSLTFYIKEGIIFNDTLWMFDLYSGTWISNVVQSSFNIPQNSLISTSYQYINYPGFINIPVSVNYLVDYSSLDQIKVKLVRADNNIITSSSMSTPWVSLYANNEFYTLSVKGASNNTQVYSVSFTSTQLQSILGPTPINAVILISYSGNFQPCITRNSNLTLPSYGTPYRIFQAPQLCFQAFSTFENIYYSNVSNGNKYLKIDDIQTAVYAINEGNVKSLESSFSSEILVDNTPPTLGNLYIQQNNVKNVVLGVSTTPISDAGTLAARIIQTNPLGETIFGDWFGYANSPASLSTYSSSLVGLTTFYAFPSIFSNGLSGIATVKPLSGYYKYQLQVIDVLGNWAKTNEVKNFYYESAILDTQPPVASAQIVSSDYSTPVTITTSSVINTNLIAYDASTSVKAFQYRILPNGNWSNWIDYAQFSKLVLDPSISDGAKIIQFKFKDFADNEVQANVQSNSYTWNIVSKLFTNVLFTVMENVTLSNNSAALLIGASSNSQAQLYLWNNNTLFQVQYSALINSSAVTAIKTVDSIGSVLIGTDDGFVFIFKQGLISGPFTQLTWGSSPLPIAKFEVNQFQYDVASVYAATLNIPRIFYTPITNLQNPNWSVLQTNPIQINSLQILNGGLWSGNNIYATISSTYVPLNLTFNLNYGISSVIVNNGGSNYDINTYVKAQGPIQGFVANVILQGSLTNIQPNTVGSGYNSGAVVTIDPPGPGIGTVQATGIANTNSSGQIISYTITNTGVGYTSTPYIHITPVAGGSGAYATAVINKNKISGIQVVSPGFATTTNISLSIVGSNNNTSATVQPDFLYRLSGVNIVSPGFGYTSNPVVTVNGISTIVLPSVQYGSIQTVGVNTNFTFPINQSLIYGVSGGTNTPWSGMFVGSSGTYLFNGVQSNGTILSGFNFSSYGNNLSFEPSISFSSSIYSPYVKFNLSNDPIFNSPEGSIYGISSFNNSLYVTSSQGGLIQISQNADKSFNTFKYNLSQESNFGNSNSLYNLTTFNNNLYFTIKDSSFIGMLNFSTSNNIFEDRNYNTLLYKPFNFDILSDWQLVTSISSSTSSSISQVTLGADQNSLIIQTYNSQSFYDSTKTSNWVQRLQYFNEISSGTSVNYTIGLFFEPILGTQSLEVSTYRSSLRMMFSLSQTTLTIYLTSTNDTVYTTNITITPNTFINLTIQKTNNSISIYNGSNLVYTLPNFYSVELNPNIPIFRFGEIFSYLTITSNGITKNLINADPYNIRTNSKYIWQQIKFAFANQNFNPTIVTGYLSLPYNLNQSQPIRVLKTLNNQLYAVTKGSALSNSNTIVNDNSAKVFQFMSSYWVDATGSFEIYNLGVNTSFIITSPFDIAYYNQYFYITGITESLNLNQNSNPYILLGLSSNYVYEEQDSYLTILYPNQTTSGTYLTLSNNNGLLTLPSQVYFPSSTNSQTISIGVASTATATTSSITVTDGANFSTATLNISPLVLSGFSLSTSSFIGYTSSYITAQVKFPTRTKSNRVVTITSNNSSVLSVPNSGLSTVYYQTNTSSVLLNMGINTATQGIVTLTASYRNSISTNITIYPFTLNASLSTNIFTAGALNEPVFINASVQYPVYGPLAISALPTISGIVATPNNQIIIGAGSTSTTTLLNPVGFATTAIVGTYNLSVAGTSIGLGFTANPITFSQSVDNLSPVFPYQTPTVTYMLNSIPYSYLNIYNHVSQPVGVALSFPSTVTFFTGQTFQTWSISTSINPGPGLALTVYGTLY